MKRKKQRKGIKNKIDKNEMIETAVELVKKKEKIWKGVNKERKN